MGEAVVASSTQVAPPVCQTPVLCAACPPPAGVRSMSLCPPPTALLGGPQTVHTHPHSPPPVPGAAGHKQHPAAVAGAPCHMPDWTAGTPATYTPLFINGTILWAPGCCDQDTPLLLLPPVGSARSREGMSAVARGRVA